jgi:hypothetical protein
VLLGIQTVVDGATLMVLGRPHTSVAGTRVAMS